jgi:hypothetical protein
VTPAGLAAAAVAPGEAAAIHRMPVETAHFAITGLLLPEPPPELQPDDDDVPGGEGPDEPIALWLFLGAGLILPVTGIGAGIARRLPRRRT